MILEAPPEKSIEKPVSPGLWGQVRGRAKELTEAEKMKAEMESLRLELEAERGATEGAMLNMQEAHSHEVQDFMETSQMALEHQRRKMLEEFKEYTPRKKSVDRGIGPMSPCQLPEPGPQHGPKP